MIDASGDVTLVSDSVGEFAAAGATSSVRGSSSATTRLGGTSTITADGAVRIAARNSATATSDAVSASGPALADADLVRVTHAVIAGDQRIAASTLTVWASADGSLRVNASGTQGDASSGSELADLVLAASPDAGAVAVGRALLDTLASVASNARLSLGGSPVTLSSASTFDVRATADGGVAGLVVRDFGRSVIGEGATITGASVLTLAANTTDHALADGGAGWSLVSSSASTNALLERGDELVLTGDLVLAATQEATARTAGTGTSLVLAVHQTGALLDRAADVAGAVTIRSTGTSTATIFRAPTPAATSTSAAAAPLDLVIALGGAAAGTAADTAATIAKALPVGAPAVVLASVDVSAALGSGLGGDRPLRSGGGFDLQATIGGSSGAGPGSAAGAVESVSIAPPSRRTAVVSVNNPVFAGDDVLLQAGRGPPADGDVDSDPAVTTIDLHNSITLLSPTASLTLDESNPTQTPAITPPAGAVLVTAALGGSLVLGSATLTFAPGSLPADAWVVITARNATVPGLLTSSAIYDLRAFDARTGAEITTFLVDPVLTITVGAAAGTSRIWYVAPDGSLQAIATTADPATGTLTAALPHFSEYVSGSPLAGVVGLIVAQLQQYLADATFTQDLGSHTLGNALTLTNITLSITSVSAAAPYTGSASFTANLALALTVGSLAISASAAVTATYTLTNAATLDAGTLLITVGPVSPDLTFGVSITSGGTEIAVLDLTSATLSQSGSNLTIRATGVTATVGGEVKVTGGTLLLVSRDDTGDVDFQLTGGTVTFTSGGSGLAMTNAVLSYNGTDGLALAADLALTIGGQSLTGTVRLTRTATTTTLAVTGLGANRGAGAQ
ncbi:MAG: hypothetical protein HHJ13_07905, partial [Phycicoccus sp.]|nr:hypothetical protein [Phycicoccus sp.]